MAKQLTLIICTYVSLLLVTYAVSVPPTHQSITHYNLSNTAHWNVTRINDNMTYCVGNASFICIHTSTSNTDTLILSHHNKRYNFSDDRQWQTLNIVSQTNNGRRRLQLEENRIFLLQNDNHRKQEMFEKSKYPLHSDNINGYGNGLDYGYNTNGFQKSRDYGFANARRLIQNMNGNITIEKCVKGYGLWVCLTVDYESGNVFVEYGGNNEKQMFLGRFMETHVWRISELNECNAKLIANVEICVDGSDDGQRVLVFGDTDLLMDIGCNDESEWNEVYEIDGCEDKSRRKRLCKYVFGGKLCAETVWNETLQRIERVSMTNVILAKEF